MTLGTLGITAFSLPAIAEPQEVCVRTPTSSIVCGTPYPPQSQAPESNQVDSNVTIDTQESGAVTWAFKGCARKQKKVNCTFSLTSKKDAQYSIDVDGTRMVDPQGVSYFANSVKFGAYHLGRSASGYGNQVRNNMAKGAKYETIIEFVDVPASVSQIILLESDPSHNGYYGGQFPTVKFRDIPIK